MFAAESWDKKVGRTGSCNFPTDRCKLLSEEMMLLRILIMPLNSLKLGGFGQKFYTWTKMFRLKENSPTD